MRILYLNCPDGVNEQGFLAALHNAGAPLSAVAPPDSFPNLTLTELVACFPLNQFSAWIRYHIEATINHLIKTGGVPSAVSIYGLLNVGAALSNLKVERLFSSPIGVNPSSSTVVSALAGKITAGVTIRDSASASPSSPVMLAFLSRAATFGPMPAMVLVSTGCGSADDGSGITQVIMGEQQMATETHAVAMIETNIDDMPAEQMDYVMDQLFINGALDVFFTPIQMKKNRPAILISVLCKEENIPNCADVLLAETTTLGIRITRADRIVLPRIEIEVKTLYGIIPVKAAVWKGAIRSLKPEYDVCRKLADTHSLSLQKIQRAASEEAKKQLSKQGWKHLD